LCAFCSVSPVAKCNASSSQIATSGEALSHERIGGPRYARAALITRRLAGIADERGWTARDGVRTRFAAAEAACEAVRLLVYQAIDARIKGRPEDLAVSLAPVAIVRCERVVAELALDLFEDESLEVSTVGNGQLNRDDRRSRGRQRRGAAQHGGQGPARARAGCSSRRGRSSRTTTSAPSAASCGPRMNSPRRS
jgi:hypothetical protein